jgi:carbon-monoxide dehydrogenase medium subunit
VKPAAFSYRDPETLEETLELLTEHGDEAVVLAGGQSLLPLLNLRRVRPGVVVDVNRVAGLDRVEATAPRARLGALVRAGVLERHEAVRSLLPVLVCALRHVAVPQVRARTTIGGSLAHADPVAELPAVVAALDGRVELTSSVQRRTLGWSEFLLGRHLTARRPEELLTSVELPVPAGMRLTFTEVARRRQSPALVGVCVGLAVQDGRVAAARVALCGVADRPVRLGATEAALTGAGPDGRTLDGVRAVAFEELSSLPGSGELAEYRRDVGATLVRRCARAMWEEAA